MPFTEFFHICLLTGCKEYIKRDYAPCRDKHTNMGNQPAFRLPVKSMKNPPSGMKAVMMRLGAEKVNMLVHVKRRSSELFKLSVFDFIER